MLKEDLSPEQARSIGLIVGRSYFNTGRYREALPYLTRYQPSPATVQDNYQIGFSYYKCGDYAQAIPYLSRLVGEDSPLGQKPATLSDRLTWESEKKPKRSVRSARPRGWTTTRSCNRMPGTTMPS